MNTYIFPQNMTTKTHLFSQCPRSNFALLLPLEALEFETVGAIQFVVLATAIAAKPSSDDVAAFRTIAGENKNKNEIRHDFNNTLFLHNDSFQEMGHCGFKSLCELHQEDEFHLPARFALVHMQVPVEIEIEHFQPGDGSLSQRLFVACLGH